MVDKVPFKILYHKIDFGKLPLSVLTCEFWECKDCYESWDNDPLFIEDYKEMKSQGIKLEDTIFKQVTQDIEEYGDDMQ